MDAEISSLNSEILKLEEQITHIKDKVLPAVVKEYAQLLNMPVVKGDFELQIAKQDYYTARQELVLNELIKQKASFELVQLSYEIELRKHWDTYRQLESLVQQLSQRNTVLCQHLAVLSDIPASEQLTSRTPIDTKDHSTHRYVCHCFLSIFFFYFCEILESWNRNFKGLKITCIQIWPFCFSFFFYPLSFLFPFCSC